MVDGTNDNPPEQAAEGGGCSGCGCGSGGCGGGQTRLPELDATTIDPQIRQAAILGVLIGLPAGSGVTVHTDDSPELIRTIIEGQFAGQYDIDTAQPAQDRFTTTFTRVA